MKKICGVFFIVLAFIFGAFGLSLQPQDDSELIKLADYFSKYYQYADEEKMNEALAEDFKYFTNVRCSYKNCATGAGKADYISGVVRERRQNDFTVESLIIKYIVPINGVTENTSQRKVSFHSELKTKAKGKEYEFHSIIDYHFKKVGKDWKITKIENQMFDR